MMEIILLIIIIVIVASSIYREKTIHTFYSRIVKDIQKANEVDRYNLIAALKSMTTEDYTHAAVFPEIKSIAQPFEEKDDFQELEELAEENPKEFDNVILKNDV